MLRRINFVKHANESEERRRACPSWTLPVASSIASSVMFWGMKEGIGLLEAWILSCGFKDELIDVGKEWEMEQMMSVDFVI